MDGKPEVTDDEVFNVWDRGINTAVPLATGHQWTTVSLNMGSDRMGVNIYGPDGADTNWGFNVPVPTNIMDLFLTLRGFAESLGVLEEQCQDS